MSKIQSKTGHFNKLFAKSYLQKFLCNPCLVSLIVLVGILVTGIHSFADDPWELHIHSAPHNGIIVEKRGSRSSARNGVLTSPNDVLRLFAYRKSWANLLIIFGGIRQHGGFLLAIDPYKNPRLNNQTDIHKNSQYSFPCTYRGNTNNLVAGWRRVLRQDVRQACGDGLTLVRESQARTSFYPNSIDEAKLKATNITSKHAQPKAGDSSRLAQAIAGEIKVVPTSDYTLISVNTYAENTNTSPEVDVLTGSITVQTAQNRQGVPVNAGQSYSLTSGRIGSINCRQEAKEADVQAFLNPANWSADSISPAVAAEVEEQLRGHRAAIANCPAPPEPPQPIQDPQPVVEVPQLPPQINDIEANLQWPTSDDLDIEITDPRGQKIYYLNRSLPSGGTLSDDNNAGCYLATGGTEEQVFWPPSTAPKGQYVATVRFFSRCTDTYPPVPFTLTLKIKGQAQTITGTVSEESPTVTVPFSMP